MSAILHVVLLHHLILPLLITLIQRFGREGNNSEKSGLWYSGPFMFDLWLPLLLGVMTLLIYLVLHYSHTFSREDSSGLQTDQFSTCALLFWGLAALVIQGETLLSAFCIIILQTFVILQMLQTNNTSLYFIFQMHAQRILHLAFDD